MASNKKKKRSVQKKDTSVPAVDSVTKKRLGTARKVYRERLRSLNSMSKQSPLMRDGLDYDETRATRRMAAAAALFDAVASVAKPICPDIPNVFDFEYEWLAHNILPRPAFDWNERLCNTVLAGAMWMLDQLRECGYFHDACKLFPREEQIYEELDLPDIWDTSHEADALYGMTWIIHHRNDDCTGEKTPSKSSLPRPYIDLHTALGTQHQSVPSRQRFEAILSMIPREEIERAVKLYEKAFWDLVRRSYASRAVYAKVQQEIDEKVAVLAQKTDALAADMNSSLTKLKQQVQSPASFLPARHPWEQDISPNLHHVSRERGELMLRARQLEEQEAALDQEQEDFESTMAVFVDTMGDILTIPKELRSEMLSPQVAAIWEDYSISDPYALCFAFVYLLDQSSELPWIYSISLPLMEQCASVLPWRYEEFEEDPDGIWTHYDENLKAEVFGHQRTGLPKRIKVPELENWYGTLYENVRENDLEYRECRNLAQILYSVTGSVMPRNLTRYENALSELDRYSISGKKALHPMLYCMTMLGELRHRTHVYQLPEESEDISDSVSVEDLQQKLRTLQAENKQLRQVAYDAGRETKELQKKLDASENAARADRQELADLRSLVFNRQEDAASAEEPTGKVDFPYTARSRIVVFGGHDSWAKEIKPRLPNVRFIDRTMLPNSQLIRQTDVIWIQSNALSHAFFYKIITEARRYEIPVRYFSFASAEKCAEQLALADMG